MWMRICESIYSPNTHAYIICVYTHVLQLYYILYILHPPKKKYIYRFNIEKSFQNVSKYINLYVAIHNTNVDIYVHSVLYHSFFFCFQFFFHPPIVIYWIFQSEHWTRKKYIQDILNQHMSLYKKTRCVCVLFFCYIIVIKKCNFF